MKVILLQPVSGLGDIDDVKDVSEGYARNFLFPRHLAVQASTQLALEVKERRARQSKAAEMELRELQSLADRLDGLAIEFQEKTSDKGQLYAAVTPARIIKRLSELGLEVQKDHLITEPIKTPGEYPVKVKLGHGLEAEFTIIVNSVK